MKLRLCASVPAISEKVRLCSRILEHASDLKLSGIELKLGETEIISERMRIWLLEELQSYEMNVYAHLPYLQGEINLASPSTEFASRARAIMIESLQYAADLGCDLANTHLGAKFGVGPHIQRAAGRLREISEESNDLGVDMAVENQESTCRGVLNSPEDVRTLLSCYPDVNLTYDAGHGNTHGFGVEEFLPVMLPRLRYLHLHDNNGELDEHLGLGRGTLNLAYLMQGLEAVGSRLPDLIPLTLELLPKDLAPSIDVLKQLKRKGIRFV